MKTIATIRPLTRTALGALGLGTLLVCAAPAVPFLDAPVRAAEEQKPTVAPQWQDILAIQLRDTYNCAFDKVLFVREVPVGDSIATEGRVRCLDGREYDFSRDRSHEKFTLRLCQPTVC